MMNENTCEMFMNDVMEEACLQECEINPSFRTKSSQNPKNEKQTMKENRKKLHVQKSIWKAHDKNSLCWVFFVWIITKMLMWNAFKPWVVFFVTIVQSCFVSKERFNHI